MKSFKTSIFLTVLMLTIIKTSESSMPPAMFMMDEEIQEQNIESKENKNQKKYDAYLAPYKSGHKKQQTPVSTKISALKISAPYISALKMPAPYILAQHIATPSIPPSRQASPREALPVSASHIPIMFLTDEEIEAK
ncbi:MAG: hypothetical protein P4L31_01910 [Candidatus Babeliales bacterium]|nr:hypothetical protein [Candidatus Babeliales bacterium]